MLHFPGGSSCHRDGTTKKTVLKPRPLQTALHFETDNWPVNNEVPDFRFLSLMKAYLWSLHRRTKRHYYQCHWLLDISNLSLARALMFVLNPSGCGHCKKMKPEYDEAAEILNKGVDVSFMTSCFLWTVCTSTGRECFVHLRHALNIHIRTGGW